MVRDIPQKPAGVQNQTLLGRAFQGADQNGGAQGDEAEIRALDVQNRPGGNFRPG
jgi:hypothetical protein